MLDVTYINSISQYDHTISGPLSPKVMQKIFNKEENLNVIYHDAYLISRLFYNECKTHFKNIKVSYFLNNPVFITFFEKLISTITTEYLLMTVNSVNDLLFISLALKNNKKVVIGGPITKIYDCDQIRQLLSNYCDGYLDNLIIVRPYIGPSTSVYDIIKNWKDIDESVEFDCTGLYETDEDYFLDYIPALNNVGIEIKSVQLLLNSKCLWSKCTFCTYANDFSTDFTKCNNIDNFIKDTISLAKKYKASMVNITDPIINFTKENIKIIEALRNEGLIIIGFTSIKMLKNEKYFDQVVNYIDLIRIGVETLDDFSLKLINKGYTSNDVMEVFDRFIKYKKETKKSNLILLHMISNLPSYDINSIKVNYNKIAKLMLRCYKVNLGIFIKTASLILSPYSAISYENKYLKLDQKTGTTLFHTFKRFDHNGNEIPEDYKIIDNIIYKFVTNRFDNQMNFYNLNSKDYKGLTCS